MVHSPRLHPLVPLALVVATGCSLLEKEYETGSSVDIMRDEDGLSDDDTAAGGSDGGRPGGDGTDPGDDGSGSGGESGGDSGSGEDGGEGGDTSGDSDPAGEFADVLAWLCTLANINGVDLEEAIRDKYLRGDGPSSSIKIESMPGSQA